MQTIKPKTWLVIACFMVVIMRVIAQEVQDDSLLYKADDVTLTYQKAIYKNKVIYNANKELDRLQKEDSGITFDIFYTPLSLVGSILSYEKNTYAFPQGGYSVQNSYIQTINLKTQKPYSILGLVDETSLLNALKNDAYINTLKNIDLQKLKACKSVIKALKILNKPLHETNHFTLYSFAILNYNPQKNKVLIRLIRTKPRSTILTEYLQLGLEVIPRAIFNKKLESNNTFVLGTYRRGRLASQSFYN
ncbi:hypothetical protein [Tenacibaculum larymnensis]|uniref:Uncharacterized protein n=1 Tax=Tenacibaculum larymnensis TaxID=2878201 RepID=A0A9X4IR91_9FLAO|nr:hypothetical protein [Tenacibaculum larymnensis]MDE1207672.1 hypothetical protein [Tenacibaculum larymnensis]